MGAGLKVLDEGAAAIGQCGGEGWGRLHAGVRCSYTGGRQPQAVMWRPDMWRSREQARSTQAARSSPVLTEAALPVPVPGPSP